VRSARTGNWLHTVAGLAGEQGVYLVPGRYILDLSGSNIYLDPVAVTVSAGGYEVVDLGRLYGHLTVKPFPQETVPTFDIKDASGNTTYHSNVDTRSAATGVYLLPRRYTFAPNSAEYLDPARLDVRAGVDNTLSLAQLYGGLTLRAASGAPLDSYDIRDATSGRLLFSVYNNLNHRVLLRPGRYAILPSTSSTSARYLDPVIMSIPAGRVQALDLQTVYARVQVPAVSSSVNVSYSWQDTATNTIQTANAGSTAQLGLVRPGTYRVEISRNSNPERVIVVQARAGRLTRLPNR
jgi:hypothetical protein